MPRPCINHALHFNFMDILLPPLSEAVAARMDGDVDLFNWAILVNIIIGRPDGVAIDGIWRTFKSVYLSLPPSPLRTSFSVISQRYKSRNRGAKLLCELSTVVYFVNCQVPSFDCSTYTAGIRIPVSKTPYHLFRQSPLRYNEATREFEHPPAL
ncbi:hypothetical protein OC834_007556 [Tilletia horrida]|nr:hypothetical protein OC834_007556 [Tilletia horrida]